MISNHDTNKAEQEYVYDDDSAMTVNYHASRTADKQAAWFLPYLKPGMTLLDSGCGSGSITVGLAKAVKPGQVTGLDISESEIRRARVRAADDKRTNIRFAVGNIYRLNFSDNSFDALFSHNVLEHVPDPYGALQEMRRVLKPGGIIGIRDCDYGGLILAPDDGFFEKALSIWEEDWVRAGFGT